MHYRRESERSRIRRVSPASRALPSEMIGLMTVMVGSCARPVELGHERGSTVSGGIGTTETKWYLEEDVWQSLLAGEGKVVPRASPPLRDH
jgi:hypothetical protein